MNNKKNKATRYSPTQSLGTLTSVNIDYVLRQQSIQYLENLSNFCQKMKLNPIWFENETMNNKLKLIRIYQFSIQYQANVQKIYQQNQRQVQNQVLQKRQLLTKKKGQIKKHKRQVEKLKEKYRQNKLLNIKQVYNHRLHEVKELQNKKKYLKNKINQKSKSTSKRQSSSDQDEAQTVQPQICYIPYSPNYQIIPNQIDPNHQVSSNQINSQNANFYNAAYQHQNYMNQVPQSYNPQQFYGSNSHNINNSQYPQQAANSFGLINDNNNFDSKNMSDVNQNLMGNFLANQIIQNIKTNKQINLSKNISEGKPKEQSLQINYDILNEQQQNQLHLKLKLNQNKQKDTQLNNNQFLTKNNKQLVENNKIQPNFKEIKRSKRSSISNQKQIQIQKSNDSFNFDNIDILQSNIDKNKKSSQNTNKSKNKEKQLTDYLKQSKKQQLKISDIHNQQQQKDQVNPLNLNSGFSKINSRRTSILSKKGTGSSFFQNDQELNSFLEIQLANESKAHLQNIQNKKSLLKSKIGDPNSDLINIIKPPIPKSKISSITDSNLSLDSQPKSSIINTKKLTSNINLTDNQKSLKVSALKVSQSEEQFVKAPQLKQVKQKANEQDKYEEDQFDQMMQQKIRNKSEIQNIKIELPTDGIDKSKVQIQVSPSNSFKQFQEESEFSQLKNKCFSLKKSILDVDNKKSKSLISSSYYFSSLKQISTIGNKLQSTNIHITKQQNANIVQTKQQNASYSNQEDSFFNDFEDIPMNSIIGKRPLKSKVFKNLLASHQADKQKTQQQNIQKISQSNEANIRVLDHTGKVIKNQQIEQKLKVSLKNKQQFPNIEGLLQTFHPNQKDNNQKQAEKNKISSVGLTQSIGFELTKSHNLQLNQNNSDLNEEIQAQHISQYSLGQKQQLQVKILNLIRNKQKYINSNLSNKPKATHQTNFKLISQNQIEKQIKQQMKLQNQLSKNWKQIEIFYHKKIQIIKQQQLSQKNNISNQQNFNKNYFKHQQDNIIKQSIINSKEIENIKMNKKASSQSKKQIKEDEDDLTFSQSIIDPNKLSKRNQKYDKIKQETQQKEINFQLRDNSNIGSFVDISKNSILKTKQLSELQQKQKFNSDLPSQLKEKSKLIKNQQQNNSSNQLQDKSKASNQKNTNQHNNKYLRNSTIQKENQGLFQIQLKQKSIIQNKSKHDDFLNFQLGEKSNITDKNTTNQGFNFQLKQNSKILKPPAFSKESLMISGQHQRTNKFNDKVESKYARQASKDKNQKNIMMKISEKNNYDVDDPVLMTISKNKQLFKKVEPENDYQDDFQ